MPIGLYKTWFGNSLRLTEVHSQSQMRWKKGMFEKLGLVNLASKRCPSILCHNSFLLWVPSYIHLYFIRWTDQPPKPWSEFFVDYSNPANICLERVPGYLKPPYPKWRILNGSSHSSQIQKPLPYTKCLPLGALPIQVQSVWLPKE